MLNAGPLRFDLQHAAWLFSKNSPAASGREGQQLQLATESQSACTVLYVGKFSQTALLREDARTLGTFRLALLANLRTGLSSSLTECSFCFLKNNRTLCQPGAFFYSGSIPARVVVFLKRIATRGLFFIRSIIPPATFLFFFSLRSLHESSENDSFLGPNYFLILNE